MGIAKKLFYFALNSKKEVKKQTTFCYCNCGNELVSNHKECHYDEGDTLVHYTCVCGKKSAWSFYEPSPLLI